MSEHIRARLPVITGLLFMLLALFALLQYVRAIRFGFDPLSSLLTFLLCAVYIFLSIWLMLKRQGTLLLAALCLLCLARLFGLFLSGPTIFYLLHSILLFFAAATLLALYLIQTYSVFREHRPRAERLTPLPAALLAVGILVSMAATANLMGGEDGARVMLQLLTDLFLGPIFGVLAYYCLAWSFCPAQKNAKGDSPFADLVFDEDRPQRKPAPQRIHRPGPELPGYRGLLGHVLLLLFTFGIWYLIWLYRTTLFLNRAEPEEEAAYPLREPFVQLLLCMFIPFYAAYWFYQSALRADFLAGRAGLYSNLTGFCTVTALLLGPILPAAFLQDKLNDLIMVQSGYVPLSAFVLFSGGGEDEAAPDRAGDEAPPPGPINLTKDRNDVSHTD